LLHGARRRWLVAHAALLLLLLLLLRLRA